MNKCFILMLIFGYYSTMVSQQTDFENSVRFDAKIENGGLSLQWFEEIGVNNYVITKRKKGNINYQFLANVPGSASSYKDDKVEEGQLYDYQVAKNAPNFSAAGHMTGGIKIPPYHNRGHILVLVTKLLDDSLQTEIDQLIYDMYHDGWAISKVTIGQNDGVSEVKKIIKEYYDLPQKLRSVLLLGHIPVPYSGLIAPDGHVPDHLGAWPADAYYADMDGIWTDDGIAHEDASDPRNDNLPGDGKFDQSLIGNVEIELGRVDFSNLPLFEKSEIELTRTYLTKNHDFRIGKTIFPRRGLIQNNFPSFPEAFGRNGINNFSRMFGVDSVFYLPYKSTLQTDGYLWSYGCGGGHYQGADGIGTTTELVNENHQTVFTMLFGSYFGDWDNENNYLRASLASGHTLTNAWAGRPHWHFHHMAIGENIGYSTKLSQNNVSEFPTGFGANSIHMALMGDPTLTMYPYSAIENLIAINESSHVKLSWDLLNDIDIEGCYVYKKNADDPNPQLISKLISGNLSFVDSCVYDGGYEYLVRAVKTETTGSGSFMNLSYAVSAKILSEIKPLEASLFIKDDLNGDSIGSITINIFGGLPPYDVQINEMKDDTIIDHLSAGVYQITITDGAGCKIFKEATIHSLTGVSELAHKNKFRIYYDGSTIKINYDATFNESNKFFIYNYEGKLIEDVLLEPGNKDLIFNSANYSSGIYFIKILSYDGKFESYKLSLFR